MIQAIMLIALGFLTATLIGVLLAPSLWGRAYRLSRKRLESTLPLTLSEIEAAQDQLRATYAVRLRRLETTLAASKQKAAMQLVDNSRLQMQIVALRDQISELDLKLGERRNAAAVLEQTITRRIPELDREVSMMKAKLEERLYDLKDLTNRLGRREEELSEAKRLATAYEEELNHLRLALEKGSADKSGRRLRRASQWTLDDYRAEYDRLNLELSRLRQQVAQLQDRDVQHVGVIKVELQKLAELILASVQPKAETSVIDTNERMPRHAVTRDVRRERPMPWPQAAPASATSPADEAIDREEKPQELEASARAAESAPALDQADLLSNGVRPAATSGLLATVLDVLPEVIVAEPAPISKADDDQQNKKDNDRDHERRTQNKEANAPSDRDEDPQSKFSIDVATDTPDAAPAAAPQSHGGKTSDALLASDADSSTSAEAPSDAPAVQNEEEKIFADTKDPELISEPPAFSLDIHSWFDGEPRADADLGPNHELSILDGAKERPVASSPGRTLLDRLRGIAGETAKSEK